MKWSHVDTMFTTACLTIPLSAIILGLTGNISKVGSGVLLITNVSVFVLWALVSAFRATYYKGRRSR